MKLFFLLIFIIPTQILLAQNFTEVTPAEPFNGVISGSIAFSDINNDGHEDVLISGRGWWPNHRMATLFTNDGNGNFNEMTSTPFEEVKFSAIAFSDINGDGHEDVFITGQNISFVGVSKLYINEGVVSSIDDIALELYLDFKVYPNPIRSGVLNISFDESEGGVANIGIYDPQGRLLFEQSEMVGIGVQTVSIDLPTMSPNSYFVQFENGKRKGVAKLIVH